VEICEVDVFHLNRPLNPIYDLVLVWRQHHLRVMFLFQIYCNTLEACAHDNQVLGILIKLSLLSILLYFVKLLFRFYFCSLS